MIEYCPKCGTAVNGLIRTTYPAQYGVQCPVCGWERIDGVCETPEIKRVITNADRLRSMSDGELAKFISGKARTFGEEYEGYMSALDWLRQEVRHEHENRID